MSDFTPGPWLADGGSRVQGNADGHHHYDIARMEPIPPHVDGVSAKANARLIAQAPEMHDLLAGSFLAVRCAHCKAIREDMRTTCMCGPGHRRRVYLVDADAADAVLKKIRGEA